MKVSDLIVTLSRLGIDIRWKEGKLKIDAPKDALTPGLIKELKENKEELIRFLKDEKKRRKYSPVTAVEKREYYQLSSAQKRLYILQQMDPAGIGYNIPYTLYRGEHLDSGRVEKSLQELIRRHESFRTSFAIVNGEPVQAIHERVKFELRYVKPDPTRYQDGLAGGQTEVEPVIENFTQPFDLSKAPLLRAGLIRTPESDLLIIDLHHIIADLASLAVFQGEFHRGYDGEELSALSLQYKDYAMWQDSPGQWERRQEQQAYWLKEFSGELPVISLPTDYQRPKIQGYSGLNVVFALDHLETQCVRTIAQETGATLFMVFLALYHIFLAKLSGGEDIIIGIPTAGRLQPNLEHIVGMFVNTLALRHFPSGDKTVREFLEEVKSKTLQAFENQEYQFEDLVETLSITRDVSRNPLFDAAFQLLASQEYIGAAAKDGIYPHEEEKYSHKKGISKFDLTLTAIDTEEGFYLVFEYCTGLFKPETIERFIGYFKKIIPVLGAAGRQKIRDIDIISNKEKSQLLETFDHTGIDYAKDKTIHELFENQVEKRPGFTALTGIGAGPGRLGTRRARHHLTYRELDRQSHRWAALLRGKGVKPDILVGIMVERSIELIVGIIAILKAGGAYLPVNPGIPAVRAAYILADSGVRLLLGHGDLAAKTREGIETINLGNADLYKTGNGNPGEISGSKNFAYAIYTSGSTGNPKGVVITHENFCPLLHWGKSHLAIGPGDRVVQNLSYFFDWSVWEIFLALCSGSPLYMVDEELVLSPAEYIDFINKNGITLLHITPSHFRFLAALEQRFDSLKYLCIGAERLTFDILEQSVKLTPKDCRVFNMYGPTEATIIAAVLEIDKEKIAGYQQGASIPIGHPAGNTGLLVLNRDLTPCPVNTVGELYIGGDGLAPGYLNDPDRTKRSFIGNSFKEIKSNYLYKTGDLVRWSTDGTLVFLGRVDHQVKLRGYRIELGEIENRLLGHHAIKAAVVLAGEDGKGENYLCAYIVGTESLAEKWENMAGELKGYLSRHLPDYMIPAYFVPLEKLPLTPNGKVNRKALPEPGRAAGKDYIAPRNEIEKKLVKTWSGILGVEEEKISINANFFEIGGHSLKAAILINRIQAEFDFKIPLTSVFLTPSLEQMAKMISTAESIKNQQIDMTREIEEIVL